MIFENYYYLLLFLPVFIIFVFIYKIKYNLHNNFYIISLIFLIFSISKPIIKEKNIEIETEQNSLIIALNITNSMFVEDIFPNRIEVAKIKIKLLIQKLKKTNLGIIAYSEKTYLISPLTNDFNILNFKIDNLYIDKNKHVGKTNLLKTLKATNNYIKNKNKNIIIFTDGNIGNDYKKEIKYANKHNIKVFIYNIGTKIGGKLEGNNRMFKINTNIKELGEKTNGDYYEYNSNNFFINNLIYKMNKNKEKTILINQNKELFYYTLSISILFLFLFLFYKRELV